MKAAWWPVLKAFREWLLPSSREHIRIFITVTRGSSSCKGDSFPTLWVFVRSWKSLKSLSEFFSEATLSPPSSFLVCKFAWAREKAVTGTFPPISTELKAACCVSSCPLQLPGVRRITKPCRIKLSRSCRPFPQHEQQQKARWQTGFQPPTPLCSTVSGSLTWCKHKLLIHLTPQCFVSLNNIHLKTV